MHTGTQFFAPRTYKAPPVAGDQRKCNPSVLVNTAAARLRSAGIETPELDARLLLAHAMEMKSNLLQPAEARIQQDVLHRFQTLVTRRLTREPVSHILGKREFWSLEFNVSRAVLDPRPDSETLIETALELLPSRGAPWRIADLGTGSGCLLLALLSELPAAQGVGVDISPKALAVAKENAISLGLHHRVKFQQGDWQVESQEPLDMILCNPPYIPSVQIDLLAPEVAHFEPHLALDGGQDGLDCYRIIATRLPHLLGPGAYALFEVGIDQAEQVAVIMTSQPGLQVKKISNDLSGTPRCVVIQNQPESK